jgi:hypothetical protein
MLRWDNTARLKTASTFFMHCDPTVYTLWLARTVARAIKTHPVAERFVFINAWNEWAEGAYLEPDATYGDQFLRVTRSTLQCSDSPNPVFDALAARMQLTEDDPKTHAVTCRELTETLSRFWIGNEPAKQCQFSRSRLASVVERCESRLHSLAGNVLERLRDLKRRLRR